MDPSRSLEEEEEGGREVDRGGDTEKQEGKCQEEMDRLRRRWIDGHFLHAHHFQISSIFYSDQYFIS